MESFVEGGNQSNRFRVYLYYTHLGFSLSLFLFQSGTIQGRHSTDSLFYERQFVVSIVPEGLAGSPGSVEKVWYLWMRWQPRAGYFLTKNLTIGVVGEYSFVASRDYKRATYYGVGYWCRYYLSFMDEFLRFKIFKSQIQLYPYLNWDHLITNFYSVDRYEGMETRFNTQLMMPSFGLNYKLGKHFYLDMSLYQDIFIVQNRSNVTSGIKPQLGLSFFFL